MSKKSANPKRGLSRSFARLKRGSLDLSKGDFKSGFFNLSAAGTRLALSGAPGAPTGESFANKAASGVGLVPASSGAFVAPGDPGGVPSGILSAARIESARVEAVRQNRLRRARTINRGGTAVTSLGSPIGGVGLTRPKLGNA